MKFRVEFGRDLSKEAYAELAASLVNHLAAKGFSSGVMHPTASSKKKAMATKIDPKLFGPLHDFVLSATEVKGFPIGFYRSIWGEEDQRSFRIEFGYSNSSGFLMVFVIRGVETDTECLTSTIVAHFPVVRVVDLETAR